MPVSYTITATDGLARAGVLRTPHGEVETPCFMAVGTLGGLKGITVEQAEQIDCSIILGNTYHLMLRPGAERVHRLGGLHAFSGWRGPMLTDSGGFQVFSLAEQRTIDEEGVHFRSHLDGSALTLSPESSIDAQRFIGADIIMAFDECPSADLDTEAQRTSMERTHRWLERSIAAWLAESDLPGGSKTQALYGIIQGGIDHGLRVDSAQAVCAHDLPGFAIGGLSVGETLPVRNAVLDVTVPLMPADKPRYLMGVGTPLDVVEAVARGIDQFDCVLPTRMGRHGVAYTDNGPLHCKRAEYADVTDPLDADTPSPASRHSRGYIRHLLKCGEALGGVLVSLHNLAYYQRLMKRIREAIQAETFSEFAKTFRNTYQVEPKG